jgi:nucleoside-diphosphate-sugar epimerase
MRILLTGATGYLGGRLLGAFLEKGWEVTALKRTGSDTSSVSAWRDQARFLDADTRDPSQIVEQEQPDWIVHTATVYGRGGESPQAMLAANLELPMALAEAATRVKAAFLNTHTSLPPDINRYALTKDFFSRYGRFLATSESLAFTDLVMDHFYGPGDAPSKFTARVIGDLVHNVDRLALTSGRQKRDFLYVDDLVRAYLLVVSRPPPSGYRRLEAATGNPVAVRDFVRLAAETAGADTRLDFGAVAARPGEPAEPGLDPAALEDMGWTAQTGLAQGIRACVDEARNRDVRQ